MKLQVFTQKHYIATAEVIHKASREYSKTVELDVITGVMLAFVDRFKWDSSKFDEEKFKRSCRGM